MKTRKSQIQITTLDRFNVQIKRLADAALVWYQKECDRILSKEKKMIQDFLSSKKSERK